MATATDTTTMEMAGITRANTGTDTAITTMINGLYVFPGYVIYGCYGFFTLPTHTPTAKAHVLAVGLRGLVSHSDVKTSPVGRA
ncbi:hypothetical protein [Methylocaldum gracile]|jgi:hypothetical protein|uniref:hypothetical protein n=1 Tax=unclassified Methylocaldum TaxID=2622260 RepID=UPI00105DA9C5